MLYYWVSSMVRCLPIMTKVVSSIPQSHDNFEEKTELHMVTYLIKIMISYWTFWSSGQSVQFKRQISGYKYHPSGYQQETAGQFKWEDPWFTGGNGVVLTLGVRPWTHSVLLTAMYWDWLSGLNRLSGHERCIAVGSEGGEHDSISEGDDWPPGQTVDIVF